MAVVKSIHTRAERCGMVYPKDRFILAHKALAGDIEADWKWTKAVAKRRTIRSKIRAVFMAWRRA